MNGRLPTAKVVILLLMSVLLGFSQPMPAGAQGFAGLGTTAEGFAVPEPGKSFAFPRDHGAHPDFRIEWWYITANLMGADGKAYGVQWTLFRSALQPGDHEGWNSPQIWMGHAGLTTPDRHFVAERIARGGIGQAGVTPEPFDAWIDDWRMQAAAPAKGSETNAPSDGLANVTLRATGAEFGYALGLTAKGPIVLQGQGGYSVKSAAGQASYYYSQPFYTVRGTISLPGGDVAVTGQAWLDREWSSQPLAADQTGWDWFSLHFDSGDKLMGFRLRDSGAGYTSATWIAADGTPSPLPPGALTVEPLSSAQVAGRTVPVGWRLRLPARGLDITTTAVNPQAWMATRTPYWEGPISVSGSHQGRGYLEMTGY
ncbi:lipocalin-like domain-containing protein [Rhizobium sp. Leaf341]|uniref:lipocalin-like domain-containing protein n=1 Tax=Rhizobium sp. Leaf341 TaxID=1736344 RepID=UPI00071420E0|nr:lipocalin-like domain-containing protein [Rhizobium sp. Leaf341]KQR72870.1 iron ABC transporter permease [Rhizobium sp. Leaf341]